MRTPVFALLTLLLAAGVPAACKGKKKPASEKARPAAADPPQATQAARRLLEDEELTRSLLRYEPETAGGRMTMSALVSEMRAFCMAAIPVTAMATPRNRLGKISGNMTHITGPRETAKDATNMSMPTSTSVGLMSIAACISSLSSRRASGTPTAASRSRLKATSLA